MLERSYNETGSLHGAADFFGVKRWVIRKLRNDYGIPLKDSRRYSINDHTFSEENETAFYLAGFIAADGCISSDSSKKGFLEIRLALKDTNHLKMIRKLLQTNYPLHKWTSIKNGKASIGYSLMITSQVICNDLLSKFNIGPRKSLTYEFPEWLIKHPLCHHFIRGYNDGDGCFTFNNNNPVFSMVGSQSFLVSVRHVLIDKGCVSNANKNLYPKGKIYRLQYAGSNIVALIASYIYNDATIFMKRKRTLVANLLRAMD